MGRVFVSYASEDRATASEIHSWLRGEGHEVFFDRDIGGGEEWRARIYRELRSADAVVCVVSRTYLTREWCMAEVGVADALGLRLVPVQAEPDVTTSLLSHRQHVDLRDDWRARLRSLLRRIGPHGWDPAKSPFPGLHAFQVDMAPVFHGRKGETGHLAARLRAIDTHYDSGVLLVAGPSGSGKSSLVRAGLVATMRDEPDWEVVPPLTPGLDPVGRLATALTTAARRLDLGWTVAGTRGQLAGPTGLRDVADELLAAAGAERLLVVVDQAEELLRPGQVGFDQFMTLVAGAARGQVRVVLTARSEFQDQLLNHPAWASIGADVVPLRPLDRDMLRVVITEPARLCGLPIDEGLVEQLISDTGNGSALPLLAFTLEQLGLKGGMTFEQYRIIGGVRGALVEHADDTLTKASAASGLPKAEVLNALAGLASFDETRRRVDLDGLSEPLRVAFGVFVDRRLLVAENNWVEVVHEALLTEWPPLHGAIGGRKAALLAARSVELAAADWVAADRPDHLLWNAKRLAAADAARSVGTLSRQAVEFLEAGQAELDRQDNLNRRRRNRFAAFLSVAVVVLSVVALIAVVQSRNAAENQRIAAGHSLLSQAEAVRDSEAGTSLRLGVASMSVNESPEARAGLVKTLMGNHYLATLKGHVNEVGAVAFSGDGRLMATGGVDPSVILWDVSDPARPRRVGEADAEGGVWTIAFTPDDRTLITGGPGSGVVLWDVGDGVRPGRLATVTDEPNWISSTAVSEDGRTLVTGGWDNSGARQDRAVLWDITRRDEPRRLGVLRVPDSGPVRGVALGAAGRVAITGHDDGSVLVWDIADPPAPRVVATLRDHGNSVWAADTSPDGRTLVTGSADQTAILWDLTDPARPALLSRLTGHRGTVRAVAFAPAGDTVVTGSFDHTAILWQVRDRVRPVRLDTLGGHSQAVFALAFSHDGASVATTSSDVTTTLWTTEVRARPRPLGELSGHSPGTPGIAFGPDGRHMVSSGTDGTMTVWDTHDPARPRTLAKARAHDGPFSVAVSTDGRRLFSGGADGRVRLWDVTDWARPRQLVDFERHPEPVTAVGLAPDGRTAAAGGDYGTTLLFDLSGTTRPLARLTGQSYSTRATAFSPDSQLLVTGNTDTTNAVWDVRDPATPRRITTIQDENSTYAGTFSSRGRTLALAQEGRKTTLYDLSDPGAPAQLAVLRGQASSVYTVAFSPDGKLLGTGGYDKTAIIWDVTDLRAPRELTSVRDHPTSVGVVLFSPDQRTVAIAGSDSPRLWDIRELTDIVARPVEVACDIVREGLTERDWPRYAQDVAYRKTCA